MATDNQISVLDRKLRAYKRRYLRKDYMKLDESATRIMINSFLTEVLGYQELEEIKTEYQIRGEYADYVIQVKRKKHFVVEVKSIQIDLSDKHLRQSLSYAANEGIDWIVLMNGRQAHLYRVNFGKPISTNLVFALDLTDKADFKKAAKHLVYLTKHCASNGELENYWKRFNALSPESISKYVYSEDVVWLLRKMLKNETGIYFQLEDVEKSLYTALSTEIEPGRPRLKPSKRKV